MGISDKSIQPDGDTMPRSTGLRTRQYRQLVGRILIYGLLVLVAILILTPLIWAISASFTPNDKVIANAYPFSFSAFLPLDFTLEAYVNLFERDFDVSLRNTIFLGFTAVFLGGAANAMAGFAFARFDFWGKRPMWIGIILVTFLIPVDLTAIPRFILVNDLGWVNTWFALIVPGLANAMVIFLFRQFFEEFPQDLIDAARVDGASWTVVLVRIIAPLSRPVFIVGSLLLFLAQWDSFFWPLLVAPRPEFRVVQVEISNAMGEYTTLWNELLAGAMLAALVPVLLIFPFQRYFIQAVTGTGLKE